jgi:uncharacterized protein
MLSALESFIYFVEIKSTIAVCRDPNGNFLLALAKDGGGNYILTGDNDLLDLKNFGKTKIITIAHFFSDYKN